jgi:hypothetical protein
MARRRDVRVNQPMPCANGMTKNHRKMATRAAKAISFFDEQPGLRIYDGELL